LKLKHLTENFRCTFSTGSSWHTLDLRHDNSSQEPLPDIPTLLPKEFQCHDTNTTWSNERKQSS